MSYRRFLLISLLVGAALTLVAAPAMAQYGPGGGGGATTTTTQPGAPPEGCPPDDAPCSPRARADVSDSTPEQGQQVTVTAPPGTFEPNTPFFVRIVSIQNGTVATTLGNATTDSSGGASITVQIPADLAPGIYILYLHGTGPDGGGLVAMAAIVVHPSTTAAAGSPTDFDTTNDIPAPVAAVQGSLSTAEEQAAVDAVNDGASLALTDDGVEVRGQPTPEVAGALGSTGSDVVTPISVAGALILTGVGFVQLRRRSREVAK